MTDIKLPPYLKFVNSPRFARSAAKAAGKTRYYSGKKCPKGHDSERMTSCGGCLECMKIYKKRPSSVKRELQRLKKDRENNPQRYKDALKRSLTIPKNRLDRSIRQRINGMIKEKYHSKSFLKIFGYTFDQLKKHIEKQFLPKMEWDNYGEWHIDHILPISFFSYTSINDDDFKFCWALSNLRPLWASANHKKHAKRIHLL